jgi:predicted transcriptional regulator
MDSLPATRKELAERQESLMEQLGRLFDSKTLNNDQAEHYRSEISKLVARRMERIEEEMRVKNAQETKAFIKKEF